MKGEIYVHHKIVFFFLEHKKIKIKQYKTNMKHINENNFFFLTLSIFCTNIYK